MLRKTERAGGDGAGPVLVQTAQAREAARIGARALAVCTEGSGPRSRPRANRGRAEQRERECCLLVLNLVSSTLPCIRQPRPRLRVLDDCGFV
jgi:hypothetical protein